jgi:hypothetical protein
MTGRARRALQLAFAVALAAAGLAVGERYIPRLPNHAGYFLVPVADAVAQPLPPRPRHAVVVVADGLGLKFSRELKVTSRLQAAGQCRVTDVGPISVSRPLYAVISTGLEQARTGSRNNDETSPLAAESVWEVAREAGLDVAGVSDVPWWRQLFPRGFDRYDVLPEADDYFAAAPLGDLTLIHPSYIDHAGHEEGADSPAYAAAVARLDREFGRLLDRLDLARDLVIFTADHGHHPRGGHGGPAPEIAEVLTCFAGPGVARAHPAPPSRRPPIAPAPAALLGLRFPRHMRALEDDLDHSLSIADDKVFAAGYLDGRRAAVDRFRAENRARIAEWLGAPGSWRDLESLEGRKQWLRAGLVALATLAGILVAARLRRLDRRRTLGLAAWCLGVAAVTVALHVVALDSFDWTAINLRERYLRSAAAICLAPAVPAILVRRHLRGDRALADQLTLTTLALALDVGHIIVFGWPLGYPLPGPAMLLVPFFASIFVVTHGLLAAVMAVVAMVRPRADPAA